MVSIVDYGMGNLRSVQNALDYLGYRSQLIGTADQILRSRCLILPGVGSFRMAMENLLRLGLADSIRELAINRIPILGICLGMQLLAEYGEEDGGSEGLGLIRGAVKRLQPSESRFKVPHMGFNNVTFAKDSPLLAGIRDGSHFYFAHSYHFECLREDIVAVTTHGVEFASIIQHGNVVGGQFHPEKSQSNGLMLLRNFCRNAGC